MIKAAIVGCGKVADTHALSLQRIPGCRLVAACDSEELMARQLCDRFPADACFSDLRRMLETARPDVVHITTPPQSHVEIALQCLEHGCHIIVEKPFAVSCSDTIRIIEDAESRGLKVTVGHDYQFSHVSRRFRRCVGEGYLGSPPLHMESVYGYPLGGRYARALLQDRQYWVRRLPGQLLHNVISHAVSRIAEYMNDDAPRVLAYGFVSSSMRALGEEEIVDELRAIVSDRSGTTAYLTFSSQLRPSLHQFRAYGLLNGLVLDENNQVLIRMPGRQFRSYAEHFLSPLTVAREYVSNMLHNGLRFLANDFHLKDGNRVII
jgi:predicted dehydrogenase